ncbi:MAG: hypothetical protein KGJ57_23275 [Sphingomonadales bacterium]|nr:hypothetical protein [Sphingomonadales bacterium]MDE2172306.1 hypothetical protein [Sphingomonadales bacterium]
MAGDDDPPEDDEAGDIAAPEPFDPDFIRSLIEDAISAVVREQGLLNDAWDDLDAQELFLGMRMHRMEVMASWLGLTLAARTERKPANDNA